MKKLSLLSRSSYGAHQDLSVTDYRDCSCCSVVVTGRKEALQCYCLFSCNYFCVAFKTKCSLFQLQQEVFIELTSALLFPEVMLFI